MNYKIKIGTEKQIKSKFIASGVDVDELVKHTKTTDRDDKDDLVRYIRDNEHELVQDMLSHETQICKEMGFSTWEEYDEWAESQGESPYYFLTENDE